MFVDLLRGLLAAVVAGVLPGYFWAVVLTPRSDLAERLTWSAVLSVASVPVIALLLAKLAGTGVTLWVALGSVALVAGSGALALAVRGRARVPSGPVLPRAPAVRDSRVLALAGIAFVGALAVVLITVQHRRVPGWLLVAVALLLVVAGAVAVWTARPKPQDAAGPVEKAGSLARAEQAGSPGPAEQAGWPGGAQRTEQAGSPGPAEQARSAGGAQRAEQAGSPGGAGKADAPGPAENVAGRGRPAWWAAALVVALGLIAVRGYAGAVRLDWPYLPGVDQFSYVVMAEQMMSHGSYATFLTYPPGFSTLFAVVSRLSGLTPLALNPVLAPTLLLLTGMGAYVLATRLWGWRYGIGALVLAGLVLNGAYAGMWQGDYPDSIAGFFLMVMLVAALMMLYQAPSLRSGALVTVVGASVVFYHPVASIYLVVLLALVGLAGLPYLWFQRRRRDAGVLLSTLVAVALLSASYAAYTYNLGGVISGSSKSSSSVANDLGTQPVFPAGHVLTSLGPALVLLGLFGLGALAAAARSFRTPPQVLAVGTILAWCALMYVGSRTSLDGFPDRFERHLGAPLSITAAFGAGLILRSLLQATRTAVIATATAAVSVVTLLAVVTVSDNLLTETRTRGHHLIAPVVAAGQWLRQHNTGGTIISSPWVGPSVPNRALLALGGYTGLISNSRARTEHPRQLPTAGRQPLIDSYQVMNHPASCQSARALSRDDVRYVVVFKPGQGAALAVFNADRALYHRVFENPKVIIYLPQRRSAEPTAAGLC